MREESTYQPPKLEKIGSFEALTRGGSQGTRFDGNFNQGDPVPFDPQGNPLIFS